MIKLTHLIPAVAFLAAGCIAVGGKGAAAAGAAGVPASLVPSKDNPLVAVRVLFHVGSVDDPRGKEGLADLAAAMLAEGGSRKLTYSQLLDALFPMAASIGVRADREVTVVYGTVHRDNLAGYYALLRQVLLTPRFDAADFERLRADQLNDLTTRLRAADDENLGKEALAAAMYAGQPYGRPVSGTVAGLRSIKLDDVKSFWAGHYTRDNVELGLAGGYPESFAREVAADLTKLPEGTPKRAEIPVPRAPEGIEATIVTKPARAAAISIGFPLAVTRSDDDFYPLMVANSFLGEHRTFNGRLMNAMRAERGLNYGDYSYVESFLQEGGSTFPRPNTPRRRQAFTIWIRPVSPKTAHFAIRQAMRELDRLVREGMTKADFEATRDFLLSYSRLFTQTASRRLGYEMDGKFYGKGSLVDELRKRLPAMTVEQVNAAIRRHLQAKNAYLAVVTDEAAAKGLAEALASNAPSPIEYATATKPEVLEEDKAIAVFQLQVDRDRLRIVPASEMFEK
jgi:zinc protease